MELQKRRYYQIYQWLNSSGNPYEAIGLDDDGLLQLIGVYMDFLKHLLLMIRKNRS